jgi:AraC family transcriptional regulator of adaptative response/methylated-DNA-[protein]-cysteine methyltransferase
MHQNRVEQSAPAPENRSMMIDTLPVAAMSEAPPADTASRQSVRDTGYELVAQAIRHLQEHRMAQPSLADLATALGCEPMTLQRQFGALAGVTPKRFVQYLTKEHARRLLAEESDVLGATLASGLSSPGRLHDLMVATEALTPGEVGRQGAGVQLRYAFGASPFGRVLAATTPRGLAYLGFVDEDAGGDAAALADLTQRWPRADVVAETAVIAVIERIFDRLAARARGATQRPLHLLLAGTNFQIKVWEALLAVPEGRLVSYSALARAVGRPDAVRAVAGAVGRNPLSVLIPCHRVIRESGELGGYHWGLPRKIALIACESARRDAGLAQAA